MKGDLKFQNWKASPDNGKEKTWQLNRTLIVATLYRWYKLNQGMLPEGALERQKPSRACTMRLIISFINTENSSKR